VLETTLESGKERIGSNMLEFIAICGVGYVIMDAAGFIRYLVNEPAKQRARDAEYEKHSAWQRGKTFFEIVTDKRY